MRASGSVRPDHFLRLIHYTAQFDAVPTEFPEETESASLATGMRGPAYSIRTVDLIGRVACHDGMVPIAVMLGSRKVVPPLPTPPIPKLTPKFRNQPNTATTYVRFWPNRITQELLFGGHFRQNCDLAFNHAVTTSPRSTRRGTSRCRPWLWRSLQVLRNRRLAARAPLRSGRSERGRRSVGRSVTSQRRALRASG